MSVSMLIKVGKILSENFMPPCKGGVMWCAFWKWLKELPYSDCPKCNKKGVRFSHEEHFTAGSPNVYHCKFCNEYFI